jgi:hypothetical protein
MDTSRELEHYLAKTEIDTFIRDMMTGETGLALGM